MTECYTRTKSPANSVVSQRDTYFQKFENPQKIEETTSNHYFFTKVTWNKIIF